MGADTGSSAQRMARRLRWTASVLLLLIPVVAWIGRGEEQACAPRAPDPCDPISVVPGWVGWSVLGLALTAIVMFSVASIVTAVPSED